MVRETRRELDTGMGQTLVCVIGCTLGWMLAAFLGSQIREIVFSRIGFCQSNPDSLFFEAWITAATIRSQSDGPQQLEGLNLPLIDRGCCQASIIHIARTIVIPSLITVLE